MARTGTARVESGPSLETLTALHPLYKRNIELWDKSIDFAEGDNVSRYIHRHPRESEEAYGMRRRRIAFRNFVDPILSLNCAYLFSKPITRDATPSRKSLEFRDVKQSLTISGRALPRGVPALPRSPKKLEVQWKQFLYDVDRQGHSIDRFMRKVAYWTLGLGAVHVLVDLPRIQAAPQSKAEERELGLQPYFAMYLPTTLVNWEIDHENRFQWVRFREPITDDIGPFDRKATRERRLYEEILQSAMQVVPRANDPQGRYTQAARPARAMYRTITRDSWTLHEVDNGKIIPRGSGRHDMGIVPLVTFYNRQGARFPIIGRPETKDIVGLNQDILNLDSLINEAVYQQVLNILVMRRQQNPQKEIIVGPENVLTYTGDVAPFFITASTAPLQFMESRIQGLIGEIYRLARFSGRQGLDVQAVPSGVAATVEFNETDRNLAEKAEELQNAEWELHALWHRYYGVSFDGTVDYPDTFQVRSFQEELQQITQAKTTIRSDRFVRELEKRCARRILSNLPQETLDTIEFEIDVIPASISSFSGPVWYDPMTQEVRQPTDPQAAPLGQLGELYAQYMQERGLEPQIDTAVQARGGTPAEVPEEDGSEDQDPAPHPALGPDGMPLPPEMQGQPPEQPDPETIRQMPPQARMRSVAQRRAGKGSK